MKKLFGGLLLSSLLLGGCAMSPQQLAITPVIPVEVSEPVSTREIGLTVYDERTSSVLGSRGGVYSETSMISTGGEFTAGIRVATEQALEKLGMEISPAENIPQFQVYIDRLTYEVLDSYLYHVEIKAAAHVVVTHGSQRFTGRYSSELNQKLATAPSNKKNDELVSQVMSDMLARVFRDESLHDFLSAL